MNSENSQVIVVSHNNNVYFSWILVLTTNYIFESCLQGCLVLVFAYSYRCTTVEMHYKVSVSVIFIYIAY